MAGHCWPMPLQDTFKHSEAGLTDLWVSGSWCTQSFVWALRASLAGIGLDSKRDLLPPHLLSCWGFSSAHEAWGGPHTQVRSNILLLMAGSAVSCNFGALTRDECASPSTTLSSLCRCLVAQSCLSLACIDCGQPGSFVYGFSGEPAESGWPFLPQGLFLTRDWTHVSPLLLLFTHIYLMIELKIQKEPRYSIIDLVSLCMILKYLFCTSLFKVSGN